MNCVAFSPDGQTLASSGDCYDPTVRLWRISDGALLCTLTGHTDAVYSVAFSPDARVLATGSYDQTIKLWRAADGTLLKTYDQETGTGVRSVQFSSDGQLLGYGRTDATVVLARNPFILQIRKGDLDCDGSVNYADILPFVLALGGREAYERQYPDCNWLNADCNADGGVNFTDINPFVGLLTRS